MRLSEDREKPVITCSKVREGPVSSQPALRGAAEVLHWALSLPQDQLDFARAKLDFDALIDPRLDPDIVMTDLQVWIDRAHMLAMQARNAHEKFAAIRKLIYEPGSWNEGRSFSYDQGDPLGRRMAGKLLGNYLKTRLGQCVSMPILLLILADRLGLDVALVSAPDHVLLRYTDADGRVINIEATSGGHPVRLDWVRQSFPMSDRAIESGLYMRTLDRRESVALMATTVLEHVRREERYDDLIAACEVVVRHDPRAGTVMVMQGSAYGALIERDFKAHFPAPYLIPESLRLDYLRLARSNNDLIERAEALGWCPSS